MLAPAAGACVTDLIGRQSQAQPPSSFHPEQKGQEASWPEKENRQVDPWAVASRNCIKTKQSQHIYLYLFMCVCVCAHARARIKYAI